MTRCPHPCVISRAAQSLTASLRPLTGFPFSSNGHRPPRVVRQRDRVRPVPGDDAPSLGVVESRCDHRALTCASESRGLVVDGASSADRFAWARCALPLAAGVRVYLVIIRGGPSPCQTRKATSPPSSHASRGGTHGRIRLAAQDLSGGPGEARERRRRCGGVPVRISRSDHRSRPTRRTHPSAHGGGAASDGVHRGSRRPRFPARR